ncbi:AAA family ATPase [Brevibacterium zhoupengii]|uniref:AAA family ATPase n=1 Tax=Brevibacterium zhoupengii TaxID=2898795 RepID=UPI001E37491F|nr:AAA family ATPase [Brevibacterium zhoupengii]
MDDVFNYTPAERAEWDPTARKSGRYGKAIPSSAIPKKRQRWLIPDMIPLSTLTVFGGDGSTGKSTMMVDVAARLSRGELDGDIRNPAATLILSVEDSWAEQMGPRLAAAGANEDLVYKYIVESYSADSNTTAETVAVLPLDLSEIETAVRETGAKLVVFDPALSFLEGDPNSAKDVRRAFDPVATMAQNLGISVLLIAHFNKGGSSVGAKLSGSHAWRDLTRSYWGFAKDPETEKRVFSSDKGNYSKDDALSYEFEIVSRGVTLGDGTVQERGAVANIQRTDLNVSELISQDIDDGEKSEKAECAEFLLEYLSRVESMDAKREDIFAAAKSEGYSDSTIKRARGFAGIWHSRTNEARPKTVWHHPSTKSSQTTTPVHEPTDLTDLTANSRGSGEPTGEPTEPKAQSVRSSVSSPEPAYLLSQTSQLSQTKVGPTEPTAEPTDGTCSECGYSTTPAWGKQNCTCTGEELFSA